MFFSADLSADDIAQKIWSIDFIKSAGYISGKEMKSCTFGLEKKHCYAFDLQKAYAHITSTKWWFILKLMGKLKICCM